MKRLGFTSKLLLVFLLANMFWFSDAQFDFQRMASKSTIKKFAKGIYYYPGFLLEAFEHNAIYKSKTTDESIKVLYPIRDDTKVLFENEVKILKKLNKGLSNNSVENGIVELIVSGKAEWKHEDDAVNVPGDCRVIVYTYGIPLFPILRECVQNNNRLMLFWYFSKMAISMDSMDYQDFLHNNIGPDVYHLTSNGDVVIDNFEIARSRKNSSERKYIYVTDNGFPIGFKPTMSEKAMNALKRDFICQEHSFEWTSYYILHERLPWQMDAIDFLWTVNMTEARQITFELQNIYLEDYFKALQTWNPIHSEILFVIQRYQTTYEGMSARFLNMSNECPHP